MSYRNRTTFFEIPYMGYGDMLTESDEKAQMTVIDNLLYAATCGVSKCIIEDGRYELEKSKEDDFLCRIKISPYDGKYALLGIINYRLFLQDDTIYTPYIAKGEHYHIYLQYTNYMELDSSAFEITYSYRELDDYDIRIKLCELDWTGDEPVLITDINKVTAKNLLAHSQDRTNPHGEQLIQKSLQVTDELKIDDKTVYPVIYDSIMSGGTEGVVWFRKGYTPKYVTVYGEEFGIGEIVWNVDGDNLTIKNSGDVNKKLNLRIEVIKK